MMPNAHFSQVSGGCLLPPVRCGGNAGPVLSAEKPSGGDSLPDGSGQPKSVRLMPVRGVMALLDMSEFKILDLIEDGSLEWVLNVALDPQRARKRELRVLPQSVDDYRAGRTGAVQWADVQRILMSGEQSVASVDLERVLNICQGQVDRLLRGKELLVCKRGRRGRGGSTLVWRYSLESFLKRRRYPVPEADN